jgi:hypothetical protein
VIQASARGWAKNVKKAQIRAKTRLIAVAIEHGFADVNCCPLGNTVIREL